MHTKLSIPERLKDLRVVDKHLTLEQLAEQTGLSKSALSKYESDDYKDISPFAIATLAEFYGVSTDYLMGLSENKNHPNTELQALHLSDDMVTLLSSGKINNRLLCEIATHENFQRLMTDIEIFVDRIADMRIAQMNLVLEATRQEVIRSHSPGDNDLYVRTLELGQVQESDFFSHTIHLWEQLCTFISVRAVRGQPKHWRWIIFGWNCRGGISLSHYSVTICLMRKSITAHFII